MLFNKLFEFEVKNHLFPVLNIKGYILMQQFIHKYIYLYIVYTIKTMAHVCMTLFLFLFFFLTSGMLLDYKYT